MNKSKSTTLRMASASQRTPFSESAVQAPFQPRCRGTQSSAWRSFDHRQLWRYDEFRTEELPTSPCVRGCTGNPSSPSALHLRDLTRFRRVSPARRKREFFGDHARSPLPSPQYRRNAIPSGLTLLHSQEHTSCHCELRVFCFSYIVLLYEFISLNKFEFLIRVSTT